MSRSAAEGLRMMQGGVDRTGFADMYESLGDPLARIRANREAARQQALLDAMMEVDDTEPGDTEPDDEQTGGETGGFDFGGALDNIFGGYVPNNIANMSSEDIEKMEELTQLGLDTRSIFGKGFDKRLTTPKVPSPGVPKTGKVAMPMEEFKPKSFSADLLKFFKKSPLGLALIPTELGAADFPLDDEGMPIYPDEFGMADGGRVEMQLGGGLMNNLLGQPGVQQALQNQIYQQPGFGSEISIGGPDGPRTIPGPGYGPGISPPPMPDPTIGDLAPLPDPRMGMGKPPPPATAQAYNPFVSNIPLYDPSTLGTGLPSTAGMTDPYFSYDPYSAAGAFDAPPANIGGFLSRKEIDDTFKDLDKFTLSKQKDSKKSSSTSTGETRRGGGGEGKAQRDKFARDRAKREANAKIGTLDRNLRGDKPGSAGPGGGKSCFVKGTMLQMADGTEKEISTVELGDNTKGGIVEMTMQGLPQTIYNYKGVLVSGSHWVIEDNEFVAVEDSKHGVLTDKVEPVYTLKTSEHRMWINDIEFGDFETGSDDDWEPHFEAVRKKLNEELRSGHI